MKAHLKATGVVALGVALLATISTIPVLLPDPWGMVVFVSILFSPCIAIAIHMVAEICFEEN